MLLLLLLLLLLRQQQQQLLLLQVVLLLLTEGYIGLDGFVDGRKGSDADGVLSCDAERVLRSLGQPGRLVLARLGARLTDLGPRRPRSLAPFHHVAGDQRSAVRLGSVPRQRHEVLVTIDHPQIQRSRRLVCTTVKAKLGYTIVRSKA